ncbi:MAG TPA: FKBP-type peptidyl-prolyl cis-trans isomerase [Puia sp.]|nr:FKBP-type peptidyl-prolyl cis-trans isomerase [Puia sp.]
MRKLLFCVLWGLLIFSSCLKKNNGCGYTNDTAIASTTDQQSLSSFIDSAHIVATKDPRGFYYTVLAEGSGDTAKPCSQITVSYKGWGTNGQLFDQQTNAVFTSLGSLIDGWREGMPLIREGGQIMLYIPPSLGYGSKNLTDGSGNVVVPANSIIIFQITLINVQ